MATELANQETTLDPAMVETILVEGNLEALTPTQRLKYYEAVCSSLGLNPLTKPFAYIKLNGKLQLYALKETTDQLRKNHHISVRFTERQMIGESYVVTACATMPDGRTDESTGAVWMQGLKGDNHSNALMKAETKAKRRATLSIAGLGMLDDSEADSIRGAETGVVDIETGELMDAPKAAPARKPRAAPPTAPIAPEPQAAAVPPEVITCEGSIPETPEDAAPEVPQETPASNRPPPPEEQPPLCQEHQIIFDLRNSSQHPGETRWVHDKPEGGFCVKS